MDISRNLSCVMTIVNHGHEEEVREIAKRHKCGGSYAFFAKGTINDRLSNFLGIDHVRRQVVLSFFPEESVSDFLIDLKKELRLERAGRGIALELPLEQLSTPTRKITRIQGKEDEKMDHRLIITIANFGNSEEIIKAAREEGAIGATTIKGHGTADKEIPKLLGIHIDPEKELILMVVETTIADRIVDAINKTGEVNKEINPVTFTLTVNQVSGILSPELKEKLAL